MAPHRLETASSRHLTPVESVSRAEGKGEFTDSEDDLDMVRATKRLKRQPDPEPDAIVLPSSDESDPPAITGERVAFSDEEESDGVYKQFKNRRAIKSKKAAAERKAVRDATKRVKAKKGSMVGIRAQPNKKKPDKAKVYGDASDDDSLMETTLPHHLQQRYAEWTLHTKDCDPNFLRLPPNNEDITSPEDENLATLEERPALSSQPLNPYKDIFLKKSAGVIPAPIAQYLRDYQIEGAAFLHELFVYQRGGVLGDDMGLGKTIQVIAFLTAAFGKVGDQRDDKRMRKFRRAKDDRWYPKVLLVCPGSLIPNWQAELKKWGWWHVSTFEGARAQKEDVLSTAEAGRLEVLIVTYDSYRINEGAINTVKWDCVIADECHKIKEPRSEITKSLTNVNALCRIGLTGTAIQNKYEELWTLLNWTNPGKLGTLFAWKSTICIPLKMGQSHDATIPQVAKARTLAIRLKDNVLPPFFLRRTKALIAHELPQKSDKVVFCPLTETQAEAYNNFCDSEIMQAVRHASDMCGCGSGRAQGWCCHATVEGVKWQEFVFAGLNVIQKLCNHVILLVPEGEASQEKHDRMMQRMKLALPDTWQQIYAERQSLLMRQNSEFCGKWRILKQLLNFWKPNGDKVLIFSHSVQLLRLIKSLIDFDSNFSDAVSYLDGSMTYEDRQHQVDDFNSNPQKFAFLISSKAGGVGLNITSANKVVVVDPHWNPSYDLQAQDRAYRIGQTRDVEVFRLIAVGTLEEIVYARQIYKQQQANIGYNASVERRYFKGVQDEKDMKGEIFGLANMFAPQKDNAVLQDIVNKTNIAESRAGFTIAGLDLEAEQDTPASDSLGEASISELADEILGKSEASREKERAAAKTDPISAILASAGVRYTHENSEVIGTSKIETKISSRATKAGNDYDFANDKAFGSSQPEPTNANQPRTSFGSRPKSDQVVDGDAEIPGAEEGLKISYRYRPPGDVRTRQFCSMAKWKGYDDVSEFAIVVESWTQAKRREFLDEFYTYRRTGLAAYKIE